MFQAMTTKPVKYPRRAIGHSSAAYAVVRVSVTVSSIQEVKLTEDSPGDVDQSLRYDKHREGLTKYKEEDHGGHQYHSEDIHRPISPSCSTVAGKPEPDEVSNDTDIPHHGLEFGGEKLVPVFVDDVAEFT